MKRSTRGSALVDVLVGLVLVGVGLAIAHSGQIATRGEVDALGRRTQALLRAQEILELAAVELRASPAPTWSSTRRLAGAMTAHIDVRPHAVHAALRQVTITVVYSVGDRERKVELVRLMRPGSPS